VKRPEQQGWYWARWGGGPWTACHTAESDLHDEEDPNFEWGARILEPGEQGGSSPCDPLVLAACERFGCGGASLLLNIDMQFDQLRKSDDRIDALVTVVARALELLRGLEWPARMYDYERGVQEAIAMLEGTSVEQDSKHPKHVAGQPLRCWCGRPATHVVGSWAVPFQSLACEEHNGWMRCTPLGTHDTVTPAPERCTHRWQRTSRDGLYRCRDCGEEQADMGGGAPVSGLPEGWEVSDAIVGDGKNWAKVTALGYLQVEGMVPASAVRALLNNYGGGR
jgi:hypothetical protein